jgi:hypothetical protein
LPAEVPGRRTGQPCAHPPKPDIVAVLRGNARPWSAERITVATWEDLVTFVRTEYRVTKVEPDEVRLLVEFEDERRQMVILAREVLDKREEWVQIASPCGKAAEVDLAQLLTELGSTTVVGGAVIMGEYVVLRHSLPLENLDINEFVDPLGLIAGTADVIEERYVGGDGY